MATVWDDKNHSSGEQFILSKTASSEVRTAFKGITFPVTKIDEKEFLKNKKFQIILIPENHKLSKNDIIFFFESNNISYKVVAKSTLNNSNFTWSTAGTSANRQKMTIIKECCSLVMILNKIQNAKILKEEELIQQVKEEYSLDDIMDYWKPVYYTSAVAHANISNKLPLNGRTYIGERRQEKFTSKVYKIAKLLSTKAADNWNPADIWLINTKTKVKTDKILDDFKKEVSTSELDKFDLAYKYKLILEELQENGDLIGVSLKQIDKGNANCELITYDKIKSKTTGMDFAVKECFIRDTKDGLPAYGELKTKSSFNIKFGGRANATKANINLEGQMDKATHQLGAIDAKVVDEIAKKMNFKIYKDSDFSINNVDQTKAKLQTAIDIVKSKQPNIYNKFFKEKDLTTSYLHYGFVEVKRFIACVSVFNFINSLDEETILDFFLLAKKIDKINPNYYILN